MSKSSTQQVVVITGAASGIGAALAARYAKAGARLVLTDVDAARLAAVCAALRGQGAVVFERVADVADPAAWVQLAADSLAQVGPADVLINNAGVALATSVEAMTLEDAQWLMGINFWGVFHGVRAYQQQLCRRPGGAIVNISSIFAMLSAPTQSLYNASKAAVRAFSDSLREELRPHGVRVLCVHPGGIQTRIAQSSRTGDVRLIALDRGDMVKRFDKAARNTPEHAAAVIFNAQVGGKTRLLIGADARLGDWLYRLNPTRSSAWLTGILRRWG